MSGVGQAPRGERHEQKKPLKVRKRRCHRRRQRQKVGIFGTKRQQKASKVENWAIEELFEGFDPFFGTRKFHF